MRRRIYVWFVLVLNFRTRKLVSVQEICEKLFGEVAVLADNFRSLSHFELVQVKEIMVCTLAIEWTNDERGTKMKEQFGSSWNKECGKLIP